MGAFTQAGASAPDFPLFFHLGLGLEGRLHEAANREAKERSGMFAYVTSALRTLTNPAIARYQLLLDGEPLEVDGVDLMITTYGSTGVPGVTLSRAIDVSDGLLDVIVIENANIASILSAAVGAVTAGELARPLLQWQAREITVVSDPPQPLAVDGELMESGPGPVSVRIVPQAVRVVVPAQAARALAPAQAA
jgi:diacylglycerol kinase family enzyme